MFLAVAAAAGAAKLAVDHNRSVQREAMEANGLVLPRAIGVSPKAPTIARSAEDAVACLTLYKGIDFGEYPVAVIASYVDNKIVRGRSKTDIIEKLEALEKQASSGPYGSSLTRPQCPKYHRAFAVVRHYRDLGPSRVLDMDYPPNVDQRHPALREAARLPTDGLAVTGLAAPDAPYPRSRSAEPFIAQPLAALKRTATRVARRVGGGETSHAQNLELGRAATTTGSTATGAGPSRRPGAADPFADNTPPAYDDDEKAGYPLQRHNSEPEMSTGARCSRAASRVLAVLFLGESRIGLAQTNSLTFCPSSFHHILHTMPVFKSPTMTALHLGPVHLAPSSTLQSLSIEVLDADAQRHQRTMSSAAQVRAALEAFTGRKGDQYPVRVILKYTDVKDWKRRDRSHVLRKLVALERELPEYAPAFAVVRWMKGYGPSEVLPMEWPPSLDAGGDRGVSVIRSYVDYKVSRGKLPFEIEANLEDAEEELPEFHAAFATVRYIRGLGRSDAVEMEWPPRIDWDDPVVEAASEATDLESQRESA
ncbi:uncharacterized protein LOC62_05G007539 [Vanrija pseudolonga]|uniref:Uncharacterized protein n=1 Tax=Vanrija pseudolonga TaxID=143232 RepID=A0AAF0YDM8_9TREE|nr:hypothetical protein LOC62_05G007539 [Vanrija pseudolonga]